MGNLGNVPVEILYKAIRNLLEYPMPTICRHYVALDLLSIIEDATGKPSDKKLTEFIVKASPYDKDALDRMDELGL